jgi:hypothetical protein
VSVIFPTLADLLRNRQIQPRTDGGYMEDGYEFGVLWRGGSGRDHYRLTWIGPLGRGPTSADPGELYLLRLGDGTTELLCVIPPFDGPLPDANVEAILDGWAEVCGFPNSVDWIRDRVWEALRAGWAQPVGARTRFPHDQEGEVK